MITMPKVKYATTLKLTSDELDRLHRVRAWMVYYNIVGPRGSLRDTLTKLMDFYEANKMKPPQ